MAALVVGSSHAVALGMRIDMRAVEGTFRRGGWVPDHTHGVDVGRAA